MGISGFPGSLRLLRRPRNLDKSCSFMTFVIYQMVGELGLLKLQQGVSGFLGREAVGRSLAGKAFPPFHAGTGGKDKGVLWLWASSIVLTRLPHARMQRLGRQGTRHLRVGPGGLRERLTFDRGGIGRHLECLDYQSP